MARDDDWSDFYASPLGRVVAAAVEGRLEVAWGDVTGLCVLGLGYATPYQPLWTGVRRAVDAGRWAQVGGLRVAEEALPFADAAFDRVLVVHALEGCADPSNALREAARVLASSGRMMIVAVARLGLWAGGRATPLAAGRAFGGGDLVKLIQAAGLEPTGCRRLLNTPPIERLARHAPTLERCGSWLWAGLGGLVVIEATRRDFVRPNLRGLARAAIARPRFLPAEAPALRMC